MNFENKTITIFGLSRSGLESALLLHSLNAGIRIKVTDIRKDSTIKDNAKKLNSDIEVELGKHSENFVKNSDLIVLSPGIRSDLPILLWAAKKGIKIIGEIELGFLLCPAPIIAVTGTNGKTTVTTLISKVLGYTGKNIHLCGNIGKPFCKEIPKIKKQDLVALEVSSFQLETIDKFKPKVAVFLNFSCNHLDRYNNMQEYLSAKKRIFKNQDAKDWAVLNYLDKTTRGVSKETRSQVLFFNHKDKKGNAELNSNQLAVLAVAKIFGINKDKCLEVFRKFRGIEHRLELVRTIGGVDFVNDSKSTTVDSAIWALSNINKPIVMIAGGKDKGSDFSIIKNLIKEKVKELI
ncbi:MAG: UDP-N-acetylmuramoyl-L-alanine--D-glutamate ligase, partial [Candidatus Omnitrophica bacterium]|nr:UDP-N-acetylmuramoyl-L-alanine--D-glutamate ligase [Candidatus Omnitrophota bacterium]